MAITLTAEQGERLGRIASQLGVTREQALDAILAKAEDRTDELDNFVDDEEDEDEEYDDHEWDDEWGDEDEDEDEEEVEPRTGGILRNDGVENAPESDEDA